MEPMSGSEGTLIEHALDLETIDTNLYRSKELWTPVGSRGVFGGQVVGLALSAAAKTIDAKFHVHSLHSYFLFAGDHTVPIIYRVHIVRDGKSYATRSVTAHQHGIVIFTLMCSFHVTEESSLIHQLKMPNVPPPESCKSTHQRLLDWLDNPRASKYHKTIQMKLEQPIPIDTRPVGHRRLNLDPAEPCQMIWMKAIGRLPDNLAFHHCVAAYCSDHELLTTSLIPHGLAHVGEHRRLTMLTSLDHAIWFHAPFRADEWLLYVMESTRAIGGRGYVHGRIYTQDGRLVMSTAQEGVIRARVLPPKLTSKASSADDETDIKSSQSGLAKL